MINQHVVNVITYFKKCAALTKCAENGDTERVIELIRSGADIHYENDAALRYSAELGHVHTVVALLEHGANVHAEEDYALRYSIDNIEIVKVLLEHGADIHAHNDQALKWCAQVSHQHTSTEVMELLLEYNFAQGSIDEALVHATNGNVKIVELLLKHGANVRANDDKALLLNIYNDHINIVELLLTYENMHEIAIGTLKHCASHGQIEMIKTLLKLNPQIKDTDGAILRAGVNGDHLEIVTELLNQGSRAFVCSSIFLTAIRNGNVAIVVKLLDNGADAYINNTPALSYSIYLGYFEIMVELLNRGENLEFIYDSTIFCAVVFMTHNKDGYTNIINKLLELNVGAHILNNMLLLVAEIEHYDAVDTLLKNGADPEYKNNWILQRAAINCRLECITKLLEHGVDISSVSHHALRSGIRNGNLPMVTKLLELGANVQELTKDIFVNQHCLHIKFQIIIKLLQAGANVGILDTLQDASMGIICDLDLKIMKELLSYGVSVHICDDIFLRYCAQNGHTACCKELLGDGANVHADNDAPLIFSVIHNHLDVVMLLLEHGADVHARNDDALCYAAVNGHVDIVMILLEHGANVNVRYDQPLCHSARNGYAPVVTKLLEYGANAHVHTVNEALQHSVANGHTETVKILLANGICVPKNILTHCLTKDCADIIAVLLECGADANTHDNAVIILHSMNDNYDIVAKLLEYNTDAHIESLR